MTLIIGGNWHVVFFDFKESVEGQRRKKNGSSGCSRSPSNPKIHRKSLLENDHKGLIRFQNDIKLPSAVHS